MRLSDFDYALPEELIAQEPLEQRDASRMLIVNRATQTFEDSKFEHLPEYIRSGDLLVVNNTRVFPARLLGHREPSGGRVEVLLLRELEPTVWEALLRPAHRLKAGARVRFGDSGLRAEVLASSANGSRRLRFEAEGERERQKELIERLLNEQGQTPLPHYIRRPVGTSTLDRERYQTVFARERGAIAAPTAGLHFTAAALSALQARQVGVVEITLHVGYGTFEPVRVEIVEQHRVAAESFHISEAAAAAINQTRAAGGRVIAVGTTTTRALESAVNEQGTIRAGAGEAELTITPGYNFRITDALLTNFHLPRSSLLLLVSAFAGRDLTLAAYRHAVAERYRFYSYGDCMFVI
ncbi:MAG TPA: tRNA preQ1(34) S-adenosylmethionine ribosyltransferase-isomerase QueA [Pyrinomonadaceae bacterium]|nr:tRNA preQ1(34) S-adenosylmethionine ribosyltransferase-isomerase QueA [Pyrinomonadaceae bacterium]